MFDDDLYGFYNNLGTSTATEQEQKKTEQTQQNQYGSSSYSPYASTNQSSYDSDYDDDYSVTPNYTEQTSYKTTDEAPTVSTNTEEVVRYRKMDIPVIEKKQETVTLTKTRERVELQPRMKIAIAMFATIMISLIFAIIWNFASVGKYNAMIAEKQQMVNELSSSINVLQSEYTSLGDEEQVKNRLENSGYVKSDETNTYYVSSGDFYTEKTVEDLPSNWFNDVCEFLSGLFAS